MTDKQLAENHAAIARAQNHLPRPVERWLLIDVHRQRLLLMVGNAVRRQYSISTAVAGLNGIENSGGTPPGLHIIQQKIGAEMPSGTVFESRQPTGRIWQSSDQTDRGCHSFSSAGGEDLILSRILTLEGQEDGVNRGSGCDSMARFIYIHGTNHEDHIGQPVSHGCVRLTNADVIDLFAVVEEGDPVVIV